MAKQPFVHWRTLPPIPKNVHDAMENLHRVAQQCVVDCPKDFQMWTQFVLVKGVQTIDQWLTVKLTEEMKSGAPTVETPGALTKALQQSDVADVLKQLTATMPPLPPAEPASGGGDPTS